MAPALAGNLRLQGSPEHVLRVMLSGLTDPIDGRSYAAGVMVPHVSSARIAREVAAGRIDPAVAIMNAIGLLFFIECFPFGTGKA